MGWIVPIECYSRQDVTDVLMWHEYGEGAMFSGSDVANLRKHLMRSLYRIAEDNDVGPTQLRVVWTESPGPPQHGKSFPEPVFEIEPSSPFDPFEDAIAELLEIHRSKNGDYARDGKPFDNFESSSELMGLEGFGPVEAALFNTIQKLVRLRSLRQNGRTDEPNNESVIDTYRDLACYSVIAFAQVRGGKS